MRILMIILLFCYYEAFVKVCAEESETINPFGNFILKKTENLSEFAEKVFRPEAKEVIKLMKPGISFLNFQADQDVMTLTYSVGDKNITNSFQLDKKFQEETYFSPAETIVHKDNEGHYTWESTLSTGRLLTREEVFTNEGVTVIQTSPIVDFASTLYYERV
ncbi:hypothetical protein HCN44_004956 [Aphidius gifuensis]|uniref:Venom protein n=1 Tax=Aphidius gifuensis TaxID=684658 RepID=A0A835CQU5_APHGI|nr:uncharacterized protein LOC122852615 [Aphidius gifuensis]KAF7992612.1 hypothetical protein HCN44_004956 [Aphidius gifuensis]